VKYRKEGHTIEETSSIFQTGTTTLKRWEKESKIKGDLPKKPLKRSPKNHASIFRSLQYDFVRNIFGKGTETKEIA